jgi:hypothetical protein
LFLKVQVRGTNGFTVGDRLTVGPPANKETVTITAVLEPNQAGFTVDFTPALARAHVNCEFVVAQGTGLDLAAPLKFNHAAIAHIPDLPCRRRFGDNRVPQPAASLRQAAG